jgi:hypothetical protein
MIAAPFRLPAWVGGPGHHEGVIGIPHGQFVLMVVHFDRGYLSGSPRVRTLSISRRRLRPQSGSSPGSRSQAMHNVTFLGRSVSIEVDFADARPTQDQFDRVNEVLASAHLAPPPKKTQ